MTPQAALIELLERVGAGQGVGVLVSDEELSQWPVAAVAAMKAQGLLAKVRPASSAVCRGCERECVMPVHTLPTTTRSPESFIVCDKRSDINRVLVPTQRLTQWQCSTDAVCGFVADSLELRRSDKRPVSVDFWEIGIATGDKRSQMLCLQADGVLAVVAGSNAVPLAELIGYHDGAYSLDGTMICQLVNSATTAGNRYTPSNTRREARKPGNPAEIEARQATPEIGSPEWRRQTAQIAANARHNQHGGSRDKQQQIREIWATGKYSSRDICAEQECAALGMSFSAARKGLRNTPDP